MKNEFLHSLSLQRTRARSFQGNRCFREKQVSLIARLRKISLWVLGAFFILAGINHFRTPGIYLAMMPAFLPAPELLNMIAGVAEVLGGIGVLVPRTRRAAGWGLMALLVAIFPANLNVAMNGWEGVSISQWTLWIRLPFQLVFMAWVYWTCLRPAR